MKSIAIIPARSGSKEILDKNIQKLRGIPLMAYTIRAAVESGVFGRVIVSTDSGSYARIARKYGADVPFMRVAELCADDVPLCRVTADALRRAEKGGEAYDVCAVLQPTCPLRDASDIKKCFEFFVQKNAVSVVSIYETKHPSYSGGILPDDKSLYNFIKKPYRDASRQQAEKFYAVSGAICVMNAKRYVKNPTVYGKQSYGYVLQKEHALDIDTSVDFAVAEILLSKNQ